MLSFVSRSRLARVPLLVASVALATACGSSSEEPSGPPPPDRVPTTIVSNVTGTLSGIAGSQLNTVLSVTVKNKAGEPIDTVPVTFAVTSGAGTVSNPTVKTTAGVATTTWTLGPAVGAQTVTATVGTLAPVTFTATATAGPAKNISRNSTDPQTAVAGTNVAVPPSVKVTDANGNPVANVLVAFAVTSGGGTVTGGLVNTDAAGLATAGSWKLGAAVGANTLSATANGITTPVTFSATATVGSLATLAFTSTPPSTFLIGQSYTVTLSAADANGNPVAPSGVTFASDNPAVATVNSTTGVVTAVGGGSAVITATASGKSVSQTVTVIGRPGTSIAASLAMGSRIRNVVTAGSTAYAALSTSGSVTAIDVPTSTVAWTLQLGGQVTDVATNSANTKLAAVSAQGGAGQLYVVSPTTHLATDSVALAAPPVRMVMNTAGTRAIVDENSFQLEIVDLQGRPAVTSTVPLPGTITVMKLAVGDTVLYAGTSLGIIYEVSMTTGAIRRQFQPSGTVVDLDVSADGRTLFVADGTSSVFVIRLATGGLPTQTIAYGANVGGVGITPDNSQLWVAMGDILYASPRDGTTFNPSLLAGRVQVPGTLLSRITFTKNGAAAFVIDESGNQVIVFK